MKVLGIYHNADLDGKCSGAIIKKWCDEHGHDLCLWGMDYGDEPPWVLIDQHEMVIISDFSLPPEDMAVICGTKTLLWFDHHISAIKEMDHLPLDGLQDTQRAGCELTWRGLFDVRPMPHAVTWLGSYDCWRWKEENETDQKDILQFQYGMRLDDWLPDDIGWNHLLNTHEQTNMLMATTKAGETCIRYQEQMMEWINPLGRTINWRGVNWHTVNCMQTASTNFEEYIKTLEPEVQGVISYHKDKNGDWKYSLRSFHSDLDVSIICKEYGGGGHAGAGGFTIKELLEVL